MTAKEMKQLRGLGWHIRGDDINDEWTCTYKMIIHFGIRVEGPHKRVLWDTTQRIIQQMSEEEQLEAVKTKRNIKMLAATILLSQ